MATTVYINNVPTVVVQRLDKNAPPIILYTLKPPPYSEHKQHELIQKGEHNGAEEEYTEHGQHFQTTPLSTTEEDEFTTCEQYVRCLGVCALFWFIFMIVFGIVFLSCSCF